MAKAATKSAAKARALEQARLRRITLDQERDERDRRIEEGAADVLMLLEQRAEAQQVLERANTAIGAALARIAQDETSPERIAALCDLEVGEVKRLMRAAQSGAPARARGDAAPSTELAAVPDAADPPVDVVDDAARRAG